jgi:hypothetical protein
MKIQIKFLVATAFLCLATVVTKAENFSITEAEDYTFILQLTDIKSDKVQIKLHDADGVSVYNEVLSTSKTDQRKYSLKQLPVGTYSFVVFYDKVIKVQEIEKTYERLLIAEEDLHTIFQPTFRQHAEYIDFDMLCLSDLNVYMNIRDAEGNIIYNESNQKEGKLARRFNLSLLKGGNYTLTISVQEGSIRKEFTQSIDWSPAIASL